MKKWLIVGDGLIGNALEQYFKRQQITIDKTSRQKNKSNTIYFDLSSPEFSSFGDYSHVFICAAITNMQFCESNPESSYQVNVNATYALAKFFSDRGAAVYYISSNTVFDGRVPFPNEDAATFPLNEYGRQKIAIEKCLSTLSTVAIIRITKIVSLQIPLFKQFYLKLQANEMLQAFNDLKICPISLAYFCHSLDTIVQSNQFGLFHLSGEVDISYADLMIQLAKKLSKDVRLVCSVPSPHLIFKPQYAGLGIANTQKSVNIQSMPLSQVLNDLIIEDKWN